MKLCLFYSSSRLLLALLGSGIVGGGMAYADDHPRLSPTRDVTVTYHLSASATLPKGGDVKTYFSGSGDLMRIDAPDGRGITILDRPSQIVTLVMVPNKMYARIHPQHGLHSPFMLDIGMKYTFVRKETIANVSCGRWNIQTDHGKASACVTDDGVILEESGVDADGAQGSIKATNVVYGDIPTVTFQPPSGFHEIVPRSKNKRSQNVTPAPVPEGGSSGETASMKNSDGSSSVSSSLTPSETQQDTSQPPTANDSVGDGTITAPDQPPTGP